MPYLTQAFVDYDSARESRLSDTYTWHKAVWEAFPGQPNRKRDFLTRLDRHAKGFRLLVVSPDAPTPPSWCSDEERWQTKEISGSFFSYSHYAFQLCANPTRKVKATFGDGTPSKNGRRVPLTTREELTEWMQRKAEQAGFAVNFETLQTTNKGREYFSRRGALGLHAAVEFSGVLRVLDKERFQHSFIEGIGSAKAFGFGLLLLRKAENSHTA